MSTQVTESQANLYGCPTTETADPFYHTITLAVSKAYENHGRLYRAISEWMNSSKANHQDGIQFTVANGHAIAHASNGNRFFLFTIENAIGEPSFPCEIVGFPCGDSRVCNTLAELREAIHDLCVTAEFGNWYIANRKRKE